MIITKFQDFEIVMVIEQAAGKRYAARTFINNVNLMR
jgi:hypothetical protein